MNRPRNVAIPLPSNAHIMSNAKARIIGYLMGDGCVFTFQKKSWEAPYVAFYNIDLAVIEKFRYDCKAVYGVDTKYNVKKKEVRIFRKAIFQDLIKYGTYGCFDWRIPEEIFNNLNFLREWLKAFCDSEATVGDYSTKYIVIYSANKQGLLQVQEAYKKFGISTCLYGPHASAYRLKISGKEKLIKFNKVFGFYHAKKQQRLQQIVNRF